MSGEAEKSNIENEASECVCVCVCVRIKMAI